MERGRRRGKGRSKGGGRGQGHQRSLQPTLWYLEDQESQQRAFPAALEEGGGSTAYDLSQMPIVYPEDLASATVSAGGDDSYCVNFTKPLFWWRITAKHICADLAPLDGQLVPVPGVTQLSLKQLVDLRRRFLQKFNVPNEWGNGRESTKERAKCNSRHARSMAWARLEHLYRTRLMHAYGAIPEELLQHFRVDVYGNVVALDAVPGSPAAFSMDHIMPWSKGGLTRAENLMALSEKANEAKSNALHCFIIQKQQRQQQGTQSQGQQPAPPSLSGGVTLPAPLSTGKVVGHLLIKERRKGGRGRNSGKPWYFLQPMPRGLQVSELIQLWQQLKDIQDSSHRAPSSGTDAAEEGLQLQASQKQRLHTLKVLLCRPWPSMLKVRHEKNKAITADGMHSITSNFVAVAKELASALPTVELTAQLARGEGPLASHPDGAPDSLSETDTADVDEESRTSDDADLSSQEDEGEEPCENEGEEEEEEEEEEEADKGEEGAPPPSNLISSPPLPPQRLPPIMPNTKPRNRMKPESASSDCPHAPWPLTNLNSLPPASPHLPPTSPHLPPTSPLLPHTPFTPADADTHVQHLPTQDHSHGPLHERKRMGVPAELEPAADTQQQQQQQQKRQHLRLPPQDDRQQIKIVEPSHSPQPQQSSQHDAPLGGPPASAAVPHECMVAGPWVGESDSSVGQPQPSPPTPTATTLMPTAPTLLPPSVPQKQPLKTLGWWLRSMLCLGGGRAEAAAAAAAGPRSNRSSNRVAPA